ncbi:hypothetical protein Scep_009478 [Stephania cephalantha]|uniref:Retroviral polymerase SH3-like domain-containing protein n=1 Tax=Stephania cephalantha TaxID=152367 RepID=A0AAP0JTC7_9MAGN
MFSLPTTIYNNHKYQFWSKKCVFLRYSSVRNGYKCMNAAGRIFITRNVLFNEHEFPFQSLMSGNFTSSAIESDPHTPINFGSFPNCSSVSLLIVHVPSSSVPVVPCVSVSDDVVSPSSSCVPTKEISSNTMAPLNTHSMITRAKNGISMKKVLLASAIEFSTDIPTTAEIAITIPHWKDATYKEYQALIHNGIWLLVPASTRIL